MIKDILKRNTFWLALISTIAAYIYTLRPIIESWNLNKTIGWGYELSLYFWLEKISHYTLPIFALGYMLLFLTKREVRQILFLLHLFIVFFDLIAYFHIIPIPRMLLLSWLTFILSVVLSRKIVTV